MPRRDFHKQRRINPANIFHTFAQSPHVGNESARSASKRSRGGMDQSAAPSTATRTSCFFFRRARTSCTSLIEQTRHQRAASRRHTGVAGDRPDNPKYRRAVLPRGHAIGRQFILKSRTIGTGIGPADLGQAVATLRLAKGLPARGDPEGSRPRRGKAEGS